VLSQKVIPVARNMGPDNVEPLADALRSGGLTTIEITVERSTGFDAIAVLSGGPLIVGAGTVTSLSDAERAVVAGAEFLVSPHLDHALVEWARSNSVSLIPGAFTPTEISKAWTHDVPAVKVFPVSVGGPDLIRSLLGPYPDLQLIPTGGINADNAAAYMAAGAVAVGVGGWLTGPTDPGLVTERALRLREVV
jgi:2-dehydro-3-deoxyphosphogluconate aldolase/(4S)-4-hydroxy-2-oxoglutarate aldolase